MLPDLGLHAAELVQLPVRRDNYIYLLHDEKTEVTAVVDPADAAPVLECLHQRGWELHYVLNTHHHADHVGGNRELKAATGCHIVGFEHDARRIPGIDIRVEEGERITLGRFTAEVLFIPGHTLGHIAYYIAELALLFSGDTLFSMGCGRLFEGTPEQMFASLKKLRALPDETWVCCTHEYTLDNGRFACKLEPENPELQARIKEVRHLREHGEATVPVSLRVEKATNPFLRCDSPEIRRNLDLPTATDAAVFTKLRKRKDGF